MRAWCRLLVPTVTVRGIQFSARGIGGGEVCLTVAVVEVEACRVVLLQAPVGRVWMEAGGFFVEIRRMAAAAHECMYSKGCQRNRLCVHARADGQCVRQRTGHAAQGAHYHADRAAAAYIRRAATKRGRANRRVGRAHINGSNDWRTCTDARARRIHHPEKAIQ